MKDYTPWLDYPKIWKSEAAWLSWIRGGIRRYLWSKSPIKVEFIKKCRKKIANPNEKNAKRFPTVWGATCSLCELDYAIKDMECDHRKGEHSLRSINELQSFVEGIVLVREDDLQLLCKTCHRNKTYSDRVGISIDEAAIEKQAIAICKQKADVVKSWIRERGELPCATAAQRRLQVVEILKREKEN